MSAFVLYILWLDILIPLTLSADYSNGDISSPFTLNTDDTITSYHSLSRLTMAPDGNFELHSRSSTSESWSTAWTTSTNMANGDHVDLQNDGELVVFNTTGTIVWTSNSITGTAPFRLIISDDSAAYILDSSNAIVWSTNPLFSSLQTIYFEAFDSNSNGWTFVEAVTLPSSDTNCPNSPDNCLELRGTLNGGESYITKDIVISMYSAVQFQVDIRGDNLDASNWCDIWWRYDAGSWTYYQPRYQNGIYRDVIIDIPLPASYTSLEISPSIDGGHDSDRCYFDNVILRGIFTPNTTDTTATTSTAATIGVIWSDTMDNNDNNYWKEENAVSFGRYAECPDSTCALTAAWNGDSYMDRGTDVSNYYDISVQFDLFVDSVEGSDICRMSWKYDNGLYGDNPLSDYTTDGMYYDEVIPIADPGDHSVLDIRFRILGDSDSGLDKCYWDNIILRGTPISTNPPTLNPSKQPTQPSESPTKTPTLSPTNPSSDPTRFPSTQPTTAAPTDNPTTHNPTTIPTDHPSKDPTSFPTNNPTLLPTISPDNPTLLPTDNLSKDPTNNPTLLPTITPTRPTQNPVTRDPTKAPLLETTMETSHADESEENVVVKGNNKVTTILITVIVVVSVGICCVVIAMIVIWYKQWKMENKPKNSKAPAKLEIGRVHSQSEQQQPQQQETQYQPQSVLQTGDASSYVKPMPFSTAQSMPQYMPQSMTQSMPQYMTQSMPQSTDVMNPGSLQPTFPVDLQMHNGNDNIGEGEGNGLEGGEEDDNANIITPQFPIADETFNIASDEFIVVGDEEEEIIGNGFTNKGHRGLYEDNDNDSDDMLIEDVDKMHVTEGGGNDSDTDDMLIEDVNEMHVTEGGGK